MRPTGRLAGDGPAVLVLRAVDGPEFVAEELDSDGTLTSPLLPGMASPVVELLD